MSTSLLSSGAVGGIVGGVIAAVILIVMIIVLLATRYKKCPSDKVMVIYGRVGKASDGTTRSAKCIHGGAAFIIPFIQGYSFLDLAPISIQIDLKNALSRQNIRIDVPSRFTVAISTEPGVMQNAAERLRSLPINEIQRLAEDIIFGQLRLIIATMDIEYINTNRDKFLDAVSLNVEGELKKIGLRLINVNVTDINDESGYIEALGKEAAAKARNDAKISVAEKDREGSIGEATANTEMRIKVATANSKAIEGENASKILISQSNAKLREAEADANRAAQSAEFIAEARANEEAYKAEQQAEIERAKRERATLEADVLVNADIQKQKAEIEAEAEAERIRRRAQGEADAAYAKYVAEAKGQLEILSKQAEGFGKIISATGGKSDDAVKMLIADKMQDLVKMQVDAIKNLKIDKVTVWDSMQNGKPTTANFLSGMLGAVPPLNELFKMNGMELPEYLGKVEEKELPAPAPDGKAQKPVKKA